MLTAIMTLSSITGAGLVAYDRSYLANILWSISNPCLAYHNFVIGEVEQSLMFTIFAALAIFGAIRGRSNHV